MTLNADFHDNSSQDISALTAALSEPSPNSRIPAAKSDSNVDSVSSHTNHASYGNSVEFGDEDSVLYSQGQYRQPELISDTSKRFLELCINTGDFHKTLGEINLSNCTSDGEMFSKIRDTYSRIRRTARRHVFQRPSDVHFVQAGTLRRCRGKYSTDETSSLLRTGIASEFWTRHLLYLL